MQRHNYLIVLVIILVTIFWNPVLAQDSIKNNKNPSKLEQYDFKVRGKMSGTRGVRPQQIALMDNNGEILIACSNPKTIDELKSSGIEFLQSQLELLVDWNLLEFNRTKKIYKTKIFVYGNEKSSVIRKQVNIAVEQLVNTLNNDLISLKDHLNKFDNEKSLFAVLYAYILHSYSMEQFGEELYQKPQLSADNPFWNGYAWAIFPIKKFEVGVSFMQVKGNLIFRVSATAVKGPGFREFLPFANDVAIDNRVDDPKLKESFAAFNIFNEKGEVTFPVFEIEWADKLKNMARQVYAKTIELVDSESMKENLGMATQAQAAMFIHYEIRYAFLNYLLEKGFMKAPVDFKNAKNNSPADVKNLVFLMKQEKSDG